MATKMMLVDAAPPSKPQPKKVVNSSVYIFHHFNLIVKYFF